MHWIIEKLLASVVELYTASVVELYVASSCLVGCIDSVYS